MTIFFILDLLIAPFLIFFFSYEPLFAHGTIGYVEHGQHLSAIYGILNGQVLYKDIYVFFGPLSYYEPAFLMSLLGKTLAVFKGYLLAGNIISMLSLYVLCRVFIKNRFFSYMASFLIMLETHAPYFSTRWGGFRFAFNYWLLICLLKFYQKKQIRYLVLSGLFSFIAFLHSLDSGIICVLVSIPSLLFYEQNTQGNEQQYSVLKLFGLYTLGYIIILIPFLFFLFSSGSLAMFLNEMANLGLRLQWAQPFSLDSLDLAKFFYAPFIGSVSLAIILLKLRNKQSKDQDFFSLFTLSAYSLLAYFYSFRAVKGPQFEISLSVTIVLAFYLLSRVYDALKNGYNIISRSNKTLNQTILTVILFSGLSYNLFSEKRFQNGYTPNGGLLDWMAYQMIKNDPRILVRNPTSGWPPRAVSGVEQLHGSLLFPEQAAEIEKIVPYVRAHTKPNEPIFTYPDISAFHFLCDRPSIDRFYVSGFAWPKKEWREEIMSDLEKKKPRIALFSNGLSGLAQSIGRRQEILPEVRDYIVRNYIPVEKTMAVTVYLLKEDQK